MNLNDGDQPLGEQFVQNPYEYFNSFVRNMNNQVFLSEYQLNHLYALLLLRKESPWDKVKPSTSNLKTQIQQIVNEKIIQVKKILETVSQAYEDKLKKNTFTQLQRLMSILKARNKSIFIQKDLQSNPFSLLNLMGTQANVLKHILNQKLNNNQDSSIVQIQKQKKPNNNENTQNNNENTQNNKNQQNVIHSHKMQNQNTLLQYNKGQGQKLQEKQSQIVNQQNQMQNQNNQQENKQINETHNKQNQEAKMQQQKQKQSILGQQRQVLSLFYGIANIPNLSSLALGNMLEYSSAQRYIKFKMSKNYIMTIKNQDQMSFDRVSDLRNIPTNLFVHGIFPYLTAVQLFKVRGVCKQWMQNVKDAWHSTFKREMFIQLMACQFCKQIQFYYKLIQLRNPFFQKISLLMHALVQIIQWDRVYESINNNTVIQQVKKVLIILLKLLGEDIAAPNLNSITQQVWQQNKQKALNLKQRIGQFLSNIQSSGLSIRQLISIKVQLLDDPFMRVQELNSDDKTPLLLVIFIKQLTIQQILKNHIYYSQQYLMKTKLKLDHISSKMPQQKGFLQGVYKIILLKGFGGRSQNKQDEIEDKTQMPNFGQILASIFENNSANKPDFVLKSKSSQTNIYMDKATKFDIILSTVKKMNTFQFMVNRNHSHHHSHNCQHYHDQEGCQHSHEHNMDNNNQREQILQQKQKMQQQNEQSELCKQKQVLISQNIKKNLSSVNTYNISVNPNQKINSNQIKNSQSQKQSQQNIKQKDQSISKN